MMSTTMMLMTSNNLVFVESEPKQKHVFRPSKMGVRLVHSSETRVGE